MDVQESRNDRAGLKTVAPRGTNIIDIISLEINTIIVFFLFDCCNWAQQCNYNVNQY